MTFCCFNGSSTYHYGGVGWGRGTLPCLGTDAAQTEDREKGGGNHLRFVRILPFLFRPSLNARGGRALLTCVCECIRQNRPSASVRPLALRRYLHA